MSTSNPRTPAPGLLFDQVLAATAGIATLDETVIGAPLELYDTTLVVDMDGASAAAVTVRGPDRTYRAHDAITAADTMLIGGPNMAKVGGVRVTFTGGTAPKLYYTLVRKNFPAL